MPTIRDMNDARRVRDEFNIARAEAIDAYALMERSLVYLLSTMLGDNEHHSRTILSNIHAARYRNIIVQKIIDKETDKKYRLFTNSAFKLASEIDVARNHIVHWHMMQSEVIGPKTQEETLYVLVGTGPQSETSPRVYKADIEEFRKKAYFLSLEFRSFEMFLNPDMPVVDVWPQPWCDRFFQPLIYPPLPGHPQYQTYTKHEVQPPPSQG